MFDSRSSVRLVAGTLPLLAAALCLMPVLTTAEETTALPSKTGLLVFKNGRIAAGRINESAGGYLVEENGGGMLVPFEMVQFTARDLQDAYRQMRQRIPDETADAHADVARWCLSHGLHEEARTELRDALKIDPAHRESRTMLKRLAEREEPKPQPPPAEPRRLPVAAGNVTPPEVRSLAGLSRGAAREFASRIQPLMMNKCGNAACHGGPDAAARQGFHLTHVRLGQGAHRVQTERNLAATLKYVDAARPERSPLLAVLSGDHGRAGRPVFSGAGADEQQAALEQWVAQVARDRAQGIDRSQEPWALDKNVQEAPADLLLIRGRAAPDAAPLPPEDILDTVLREEQKDAFDPAEFNRRMHGKPR